MIQALSWNQLNLVARDSGGLTMVCRPNATLNIRNVRI
jgi:hypothetical protein